MQQHSEQSDELLMSLVESAMRCAPADRAGYLAACCHDPELRRDVEGYIAAEERMGRFLLDPIIEKPVEKHAFGPGDLLAERFRIVRQVGAGGMGVVFEAVDEKLDRRVALKCAKPGHLNSLPPEARAAREVSHYYVCKVHDLHAAETPQGHMEFLSMEFIEGGTLSERIGGQGPVPAPEAAEIARQLCAGLAQAHAQGVIHGDLKCSNIILARASGGGVRAVITDFGLAKMTQIDGSVFTSVHGGTLDYMSPELMLGNRATVASDIYALGVLFHIMLTGRAPERLKPLPESQTKTAGTLALESRAATVTMMGPIVAADWERKIDALPAPWGKLVAACMEPAPEKRIGSVEAIGRVFAPKRTGLKWVAVAAVAALAPFGYWQWTLAQPSGVPVRLAILPFTADGGTAQPADGIAADIAERLTGARRNFTVISARETQRNRVDAPEKARTVLGATHVLQAVLHGAGSQVTVSASVLDLNSKRDIAHMKETYSAAGSPDVAKAILSAVTGAFHLRSAPKESVSAAAYGSYVQGIDLLRQDARANAEKAIPFFEKAIQLDPKSALPYAGLAEAQMHRAAAGEGERWVELAGGNIAQAKRINSDSPPVLLVSSVFEQHAGHYEEAIHLLTRATELEPGSSEAWRRLAVAYQNTNRADDAIATYRKAIEAQPDYYVPYLDFGNFYWSRSQFGDAEAQYRKVTQLAPGFADGHMNMGLALTSQGRLPEAEQALLKALQLRKSSVVLMNLGALCYEQERYQDAARYVEQGLAAGLPSSIQYRNLGDAYRHLNRPKESSEAYRSGLALAEADVARNPRNVTNRARLGVLSALLGDKRRSDFEIAQALSMNPGDGGVIRQAVLAYEALHDREKTLEVLGKAQPQLLDALARHPDLRSLQGDPAFQQMLHKGKTQ